MERIPEFEGRFSLFPHFRARAIRCTGRLDGADDLVIEKRLADESRDEILSDSLLDGHIVLIKITGNHHHTGGWIQLVNLLSKL